MKRSTRWRRVAVTSLCLAAIAASFAASASAATYGFGPDQYEPQYYTQQGPVYANTVAVEAQGTTNTVCAGAELNGSFYGHYYCAAQYACHDYGANSFQGMAHNHTAGYLHGESVTYSYSGIICPAGAPLSSTAQVSVSPSAGGALPNAYAFSASDGRTCVSISDPGGGHGISCASAARLAAGLLVGWLESAPGQPYEKYVVAAAPPHATSAVLVDANGSGRALAIKHGVAVAAANPSTVRITWTAAGGRIRSAVD